MLSLRRQREIVYPKHRVDVPNRRVARLENVPRETSIDLRSSGMKEGSLANRASPLGRLCGYFGRISWQDNTLGSRFHEASELGVQQCFTWNILPYVQASAPWRRIVSCIRRVCGAWSSIHDIHSYRRRGVRLGQYNVSRET